MCFQYSCFTDIPTAEIIPDADLSVNQAKQPFESKATNHSQPLQMSNFLQPTPQSSSSTPKNASTAPGMPSMSVLQQPTLPMLSNTTTSYANTFASPNISTVIVRMIMSMSLPDDGWTPYVRLSINGNRQPDTVPQAITGSSGSEEFITVKFGTSSCFLRSFITKSIANKYLLYSSDVFWNEANGRVLH